MQVEDRLRDFIVEQLQWEGSPTELTDDYELLDNGVLDSLGLFKTVAYIEDEFDISVEDEELLPDNFGTISAIAGLIRAKRDGS